ncbi:hypothetical protein GH733_014792 [Mirounga leonina]|nr:hypothetical protein GH733_014792 [Mirounga leonina]
MEFVQAHSHPCMGPTQPYDLAKSFVFFGNTFIMSAIPGQLSWRIWHMDLIQKMSQKKKDERILWKKNKAVSYKATTFSILYNNILFLILVIVASFFILMNFNPTVDYILSITVSSGLIAPLSTGSKWAIADAIPDAELENYKFLIFRQKKPQQEKPQIFPFAPKAGVLEPPSIPAVSPQPRKRWHCQPGHSLAPELDDGWLFWAFPVLLAD